MSSATANSVTVQIDPTKSNLQADVIPGATPTKAGAMTAAQAAQLASIVAGTVSSVSGTAPIVSTGGLNPDVSITPATPVAAGSMSAADKAKLDALNPSEVTQVTGSAPITSTGGATPDIGITPATTLAAGSLSAADKTKLDGLPSSVTLQTAYDGGKTVALTNASSPVQVIAANPASTTEAIALKREAAKTAASLFVAPNNVALRAPTESVNTPATDVELATGASSTAVEAAKLLLVAPVGATQGRAELMGLVTEQVPGATRQQVYPRTLDNRVYYGTRRLTSTSLVGWSGIYMIPFAADPSLETVPFIINGVIKGFFDKGGLYGSRFSVREAVLIPTVVPDANAGTGATASVQAGDSDSAMKLTLSTGNAAMVAGTQATVTNGGGAWIGASSIPVITPGNDAAALLSATGQVYAIPNGTAGMLIKSPLALAINTTYVWFIIQIGR